MLKRKLLLLYGLTSGIYINFIGRLVFSEVIALFFFPFTKFSYLFRKFKNYKYIFKLFSLLFFAQIISDVVNNSVPNDYLRGLSVILFSFISVTFLLNQINKNSKLIIPYFIILFFIKLVLGEHELDVSIIQENSNFFKSRFVGFLNLGFMIASFYLFKNKKKQVVPVLFFSYAMLCLILDARSNGLIFLISSVILFFKNYNIKFNKSNSIILLVFSSLILYLGYIYYVDKVMSNEIGGSNSKNQVASMSNPYNPFELLYYGRLETIIAMKAISEKPIFGHGSWAVDKDGKYAKLTSLLSDRHTNLDKAFIPSHSIVLGAWLYAGLLGFIAMFLIFKHLFSLYFKILKKRNNYFILPILTVLTVDFMWASLFSPFGALRTTFPIFAALLIYYERVDSL